MSFERPAESNDPRAMKKLIALAATAALALPAAAADPLTSPLDCRDCAIWNQPEPPVHLYGNSYYVGVSGLASVLIETRDGLILLDGDLPQSVPQIEDNIKALGHDVREVKLILVSHEHFDHVGGIAALKGDSGARVLAGAEAAMALGQGHPTEADPQYGKDDKYPYPRVAGVETVTEGQTLTLGEVTVTAHRTPGHTPGGTSWSWRSCEKGKCLDMVYADSLTAMSTAAGYRFAPVAETFRASIAKVRGLPCDILVTTHPTASGFWKKMEQGSFVDSAGCRTLADKAEAALDRRLAEEAR